MNFLEPRPTRCFPGSVRRFLFVAVLVLAVASVLPAAASAALTATQIRVGNHPAFVRVVVDFTRRDVASETTWSRPIRSRSTAVRAFASPVSASRPVPQP